MADCKNNADYTADSEKYMSNCNHSSEDWVFSVGGSTVTKKVVTDDIYFEGITDVTINQGADFDPTEGVSAHDGNGNELPFEVVPSELTDPCEIGEHDFEYKAYKETHPLLPTWCNSDKRAIYVPPCNMVAKIVHRIVTVVQSALPTFSGLVKAVLNVGQSFDPMSGVSATDANDNVIEDITYSGTYDDEANGKIASFETEFAQNAKAVETSFEPIQDGTPWMSDTLETEPYNYRKTADGTIEHSFNSEYDEIVGASVGWNQLAPNNYSKDVDALVPFTSGTTIVAGHKYLVMRKLSASLTVDNYVYARVSGSNKNCFSITGTKTATIKESAYGGTSIGNTSGTDGNIWIYQANGGNAVAVSDLMFIDLTLFNSAIADYVYSLETATAGSGVTWLKTNFPRLFDNGYQPYDSGSIKSVSNIQSHDMVGKNLFDSISWATIGTNPNYYSVDVNGEITVTANDLGGIGNRLIDLPPNWHMKLIASSGLNPTVFSSTPETLTSSNFVVPSDGKIAVKFRPTSYPTKGWAMIVPYDVTATDYEPYIKHGYPLDSSVTLRGEYKLDANNNLYADGDTWKSVGQIGRTWSEVDLGTLDWMTDPNRASVFRATVADKQQGQSSADRKGENGVICGKYAYINEAVTTSKDKYISDYPSYGAYQIFVRDTAYTDVTAFANAMSGTMLVYQRATVVTEQATPYDSPQTAIKGGTEEYIGSELPVGHNTRYADIYPISGWNDVEVTKTGINIWDEEWELGGYDANGNKTAGTSRVRSKNRIPCTPSTTYYFACAGSYTNWITFCQFDADGNSLGLQSINHVNNVFTTHEDAHSFCFFTSDAYGTSYNNDISINYPSTDHDYHAYQGATYTEALDMPIATDDEPYLMKTVGNIDSERMNDEIIGASIGWNQLSIARGSGSSSNGIVATEDADGIITLSGTAISTYSNFLQNIQNLADHKIVMVWNVLANPNNLPITMGANSGVSSKYRSANAVVSRLTGGTAFANVGMEQMTSGADYTGVKLKVNITDLTLALGSQIADYVYSLEQSTSGSGVAWLKQHFPIFNSYQPFDDGSVKSIEGLSAHKMTGVNQWGGLKMAEDIHNIVPNSVLDTTAKTILYSASDVQGKILYDKFLPNTQYTIILHGDNTSSTKAVNMLVRYTDGTTDGLQSFSNGVKVFVTDATKSVESLKGQWATSETTLYYEQCGVFEGVLTADQFEPYTEYSYPLDSSKTLRGRYYLDSNNQLRAVGDIYKSSGEIDRNYGEITFDGTESWYSVDVMSDSLNRALFTGLASEVPTGAYSWDFVANYVIPTNSAQSAPPLWQANFNAQGNLLVGIPSTITTVAEWKAYLSQHPLTMVYRKKSTTTEQADAYVNPQRVISGGTQQYVSTSLLPVGHHTDYLANEVYGGTIDLVSGVLTVTHVKVSSFEVTYGVYDAGTHRIAVVLPSSKPDHSRASASSVANMYCSNLKVTSKNSVVYGYGNISYYDEGNLRAFIARVDENVSSIADMNTWATAHPFEIVYELATPQTYQLTRHQISLLLGQNNVWSDTNGETRVVFMKNLPQSGSVTYPLVGTYEITYEAEDQCGNIGTATREVEVTAS